MDLNEIAAFTSVIRFGGFSQASRQTGVPKSTLSRKVSDLESRLGVRLMQRTTRQMKMTKAGENYYQHCSQILQELERVETITLQDQEKHSGIVKISVPVEVGTAVFPELVVALRKLYPEIDLELNLSDRRVDLVAEGYDFALRAGPMRDSAFKAKKVGQGEFGLFASPKYLQRAGALAHPRDLKDHDLLVFCPNQEPVIWTLQKDSARFVLHPEKGLRSNSLSLMRKMAVLGYGVTILPIFLCQEPLKKGSLVRILPDWGSGKNPFYLIYPEQKYMPPRVKIVLDFLFNKLTLINW